MSKMKRELKIGVVLDRLMKERHLSIKELSYESGIPQSSLGHMLANRQPRELTKNALALCEVFNVSLFYLLYGETDPMEKASRELEISSGIFGGVFEVTFKKIRNR